MQILNIFGRFRTYSYVRCGAYPPFRHFEPNYASLQPKSAGSPVLLASAFNRESACLQSSLGNSAYCYAELALSSMPVVVTIASTHFAYPRKDA